MSDDDTWTFPRVPLPDPAGGTPIPTSGPAVPLNLLEFATEHGFDTGPGSAVDAIASMTAAQMAQAMEGTQAYLRSLNTRGALYDMSGYTVEVGGVTFPAQRVHIPEPQLAHITLSSRVMGLDFSDFEARALAGDLSRARGISRETLLGAMYANAGDRTFVIDSLGALYREPEAVMTTAWGVPATADLRFELTACDFSAFSSWFDTPEPPAQSLADMVRTIQMDVNAKPSTGVLGALAAREITDKICTWVQKPVDAAAIQGHNNNTGAAFHPPEIRSHRHARSVRDQASGPLPRSGGRQHW